MEIIKDKTLGMYHALVMAAVKKDAINIINGKPSELSKAIKKDLLNLWLNGYDKGFKDCSIAEQHLKTLPDA